MEKLYLVLLGIALLITLAWIAFLLWGLLLAKCVKRHSAIEVLLSMQIGSGEWPL